MKKDIRKNKGITMVVLIITIIILLILAMVAIGAIKDTRIIKHAQNATTEYGNKQTEEVGKVIQYETLLDKKQPGESIWKMLEDGETIKNQKSGKTTKLGDTFENDEVLSAAGGTKKNYTGKWTVLGVENGKLKLVSTNNVNANVMLGYEDERAKKEIPLGADGRITDAIKLERSIWSYQNVQETLDLYAQEETGIESARSITIKDLESKEILDITEEKKKNYEYNYGQSYTYAYDEGKIGTFVDKEGTKIVLDSSGKKVNLDYSYYTYSQAFQGTKFANSLGNETYWLASPCVSCFPNFAFFNMHYVSYGNISTCNLFNSNGGVINNKPIGIRAIVYI